MVEEVNVRMSLYGILISLLLNLGRAKRESFQNKPGFHVMGGDIGFTDQRPLLYWGHLQGWGLRLSLRVLVLIGQLLPGWWGALVVLVAFPHQERLLPAQGPLLCSTRGCWGLSTLLCRARVSSVLTLKWEVRALPFGQPHILPSSAIVAVPFPVTTLLTQAGQGHVVLKTTLGGRKAKYGGPHLQMRKLKVMM